MKVKLTGWKMISRHLERSERAVQFWEEQRGLPIHRIPGGRGQTVFAYVAELDDWMNSASLLEAGEPVRPTVTPPAMALAAETQSSPRPPGILVLPLETRSDFDPCGISELLCQQLIVRLSAVQPVRVLSWSTSRTISQSVESLEATATRLNVRYLVESAIVSASDTAHVEVRIVDADIDQILLADRFVVDAAAPCTVYAGLAEAVALHFALLHAGALVEPMCLGDMTPTLLLRYLAAARAFFDDADGTSDRALRALDALVAEQPDFMPARAMRGLALLQSMQGADSARVDEARGILAACGDATAARVTSAFLAAAVVRHVANGGAATSCAMRSALRWIPPSVARHGRLHERRSLLRDGGTRSGARMADERRGQATRVRGHRLLDELLQDLVTAHQHGPQRTDAPRAVSSGVQDALVMPSANDASMFRRVNGEGTEA